MDVEVIEAEGGYLVMRMREAGSRYRVRATEHGLRDIEFALAQRRAMSRRCTETQGEHTCALPPGHGTRHECRACDRKWTGDG
jgi:hypothetical protein